jgi:hypothetical protein
VSLTNTETVIAAARTTDLQGQFIMSAGFEEFAAEKAAVLKK